MTLPVKLHGGVIHVTPTTVWRWQACRRRYLLCNLLQLPALDTGAAAVEGQKVHGLLRLIHARGTCTDGAWVREVVDNHAIGDAPRMRGYVERHARLCPGPAGAEAVGHEVARSRADWEARFVASASIDAVWVHGHHLEGRDYKTGGSPEANLALDLRARLQVFVLEPEARARGLQLRLRYEYLGPEAVEQPPPWDPEPEELAEIRGELRELVDEIRAERDFRGVSDPRVCGACEYRSVCVDAAVEGGAPSAPPV